MQPCRCCRRRNFLHCSLCVGLTNSSLDQQKHGRSFPSQVQAKNITVELPVLKWEDDVLKLVGPRGRNSRFGGKKLSDKTVSQKRSNTSLKRLEALFLLVTWLL